MAETAAAHLEGGDQATWLARFEEEQDNLRLALAYCVAEEQAEELLNLAARCWRYWWLHGHWDEGRRWLERGLACSVQDGPTRLKALEGATFLAYLRLDLVSARSLAEEQLAAARHLDNTVEVAKALHALANVTLEEGDRGKARALYERSLSYSGDHPFARYTLHALGYLAIFENAPDQARMFLKRSLAISEAQSDDAEVANTLGILAFAALKHGEKEDASELLRRSMRLAVRLGDKPVIASRCFQGAAALLAERGAAHEAARLLGAADLILQEMGSGLGQLGETVQRGTVDVIRRQLGEDSFERGRIDGRSMPLDEAVALARRSLG